MPQIKNYETNAGNLIFDNLFNKKLRFYPVQNPSAMARFYESIGWGKNYNPDYLKYALGLALNETKLIVGSGHFVSTFKKQIFREINTFSNYQMGGDSEEYLDRLPLKFGNWRVTTFDNFAYRLGNTVEDWMAENLPTEEEYSNFQFGLAQSDKKNKILAFFKNRFFVKFISYKFTNQLFLRFKKLPKEMISKY